MAVALPVQAQVLPALQTNTGNIGDVGQTATATGPTDSMIVITAKSANDSEIMYGVVAVWGVGRKPLRLRSRYGGVGAWDTQHQGLGHSNTKASKSSTTTANNKNNRTMVLQQ